MKRGLKKHYLYILLLVLSAWFSCFDAQMSALQAQTDTIRYVRTSGKFNNDGKSWATSKNNLQEAINDLRDYLKANNLTSGSVYVAAGTYVPSESTESSGGSMLNTSFKIYSGIHVYGGFNPSFPEATPGDRVMVNGKRCADNWSRSAIGTTDANEIASQWDFKYKTILSGNHSTSDVSFSYDKVRGRFNTSFPANSYHVVWFATNGRFEVSNDSIAGHYKPLEHPASLNGCVISGGNASTRASAMREHTAYGGGVYMVANSELRGCTVEYCSATMRGGGVYLDGGGTVEFCYVHTCQSPGMGVVQGYGGGVCVDYDGQVGHSHITNCAARCGGGLAICHVPAEYPIKERIKEHTLPIDNAPISFYYPFAAACVINNNTASAEGGGIYLAEGGTINHCTVTANNCIGPDVTYYGRRHGRSGGIYIRDCGMLYNSVFWGNRCQTNNDIQFASVRQVKDTVQHKVFVYHCAFMNHDISDWTDVQKEMVFSLEKSNLPVQGTSSSYPCFFDPTVNPGNWDDKAYSDAGVFCDKKAKPETYPGPRIWHLSSYSALDQKGVQVVDAVQDVSQWIRHAHTDYGVVTNLFEPVSTLGALVRKPDAMTYALVAPQGTEGRQGTTPIPTLFIDPNRKGVFDSEGKFRAAEHEGNSWDLPIKDLGEAIQFFRQYLVDDDGSNHHYMIPALDAKGQATGEPTRYDYVQILVKEGTINTAGTGNYLNWNIRTASVRVESHMRLYGGYPSSLSGTATEGRNPRTYESRITSNVTSIGGERGYENNSAHVIAMVNVEHTIIDGFTLSDANTHNVELSGSAMAGGGVLINNQSTPQAKRIHMTGNKLRNCVITNCSSPKGAAVYVNGEFPNSEGYICYAELKMVNCVIRNNTADYENSKHQHNNHGIITANGRAYIEIEHCDIVNNVGYPFKADDKTTDTNQQIMCQHPEHNNHGFHGYIRVNNSIVFCNGEKPIDDRGELGAADSVMSVFPDGQDYVFGEYNMFDKDLRLQLRDPLQPHGFFNPDFAYNIPSDFLPENWQGTTFGSSLLTPLPSEKNNKAIFTRTDRNAPTYPSFINPSRNVGTSINGDRPLYGGIVSYAPLTTNPCVNAAGSQYPASENYDRTDNCVRNRGGAADIGAIECADLPVAGAILYVTPDGAGKRDGSSWNNAIAGNTVYLLSSVAGPDLADGDYIDATPTCDRVLDSEGNPVLTTDKKYNGGWGRVWYTDKRTGATSTTTVTTTWITEKNTYSGGPKAGQTEVVQDGTTPTESTNTIINKKGSQEGGFVAGYDFDPRYPYGEISGASRSFWRANPYHNGTDWNNAKDYADRAAFITACNANGWINNTRAERYVSGLQYAVEKASTANKTLHKDSIQVWVGAGTYTDYKGFVMRDSVTVLGGFPAGKFAAPAMSERQALMSDVVSIPKSKPAANFDAVDYETVLQISDVNPNPNVENRNDSLNSDAVKYWDDDYSRSETTDTRNYAYKTRKITNTYTYSAWEDDVTSTYIYGPTFNTGSNMNPRKDWTSPDSMLYCYGAQSAQYDYWNIRYPSTQTYYNVDINRQNNVSIKVYNYDDSTFIENKSSCWYRIGNGSLAGLSIYQTMRNVDVGTYKLTLDLNGGYRNTDGSTFDMTTPSNIFLHIRDAAGNELITPVLLKCCGTNSVTDNNKDRVRKAAFRKTVEFENLALGDVTISVEVLDGTKNTKSKNKDYGTDDGSDPYPIPCDYVWDNKKCNGTGNNWGTNNPNRREFFITNLKLTKVDPSRSSYARTNQDIVENDTVVDSPRATEVTSASVYTSQTHRVTLRKRVLTMPDVCVPTYGAGSVGDPADKNNGKLADALAHTDRVFGPTKALRTAATLTKEEDPHYVEYNEANWDGFTIRHGFLTDEAMAHGGGAGVNIYEGAHLKNCIVINNMSHCPRVKGGGLFCDGSTSTIEGCFVLNNQSTLSSTLTANQAQIFAGGMFMYEGTCFNSLFANNYSYGSSGGVGFCVGRFFNNTIAYNTATLVEGSISGGAISLATESNPNLFVANTIVFGNNGIAIRDRNAGVDKVNPFLYCYIQSAVAQPNNATLKNVTNWTPSATGNYGTGNTFLNGVAPSADNTPFAADFDENGNYVEGRAASLNDFRLRDDVPCVNKGTEDFAGEFYTALRHKNISDANIKKMYVYQTVLATELPQNDVAFAKRVQDCQIDIGAYEYNAAYAIRPDTTTHPGKAIFYVSFDSPGGDASARSPENAACRQKLQQVLDAAGRYKYALMTDDRYNHGATLVEGKTTVDPFVADEPNKYWTVEVRLEGDSTNATRSRDYAAYYTPTRSVKHGTAYYTDNTLDYSFIIPHGVQLKGGYTSDYYHYEDASGNPVAAGTTGARIVDERDPLTFRTVLSGQITSITGAEGNCFHVVTFTDDLFETNELKIGEGNQLAAFSALSDAEAHRAVVDGVFIEDGLANSPDEDDRMGAAAVVPSYAHISNCVVQNNEAKGQGGGLYLKPGALVSGTILRNNTADMGGGIYIEAPSNPDTLAHVFATTICENNANTTAGGMWFSNTYARVSSTVIWNNAANDFANVSGSFNRTDAESGYPFSFCGIESRRVDGQGNVELSPRETEGVRWDRQDPFNAILYYPIEMSSTLSRAGMTYSEWNKARSKYTTLDTIDIAGVHRTRWTVPHVERGFTWGEDTLVVKNNDFIEIGARALNKNFEINVDERYVMRRLYVMHTELLDPVAARTLQDNTKTDSISLMYKQLGSCMLNPFHRLGDAFDYIIAARKLNPAKYRNARFEVYVERGTFYPYHNPYGEQTEVRTNTFLIPEATTVVGGVNSQLPNHKYCQAGYEDKYTNTVVGNGNNVVIPGTGYVLDYATATDISRCDADHRPMSDYNLNSVIEPWEFERQTILSGNVVSGEDYTHVYHIITVHADSAYIGPQPYKYRTETPNANWRNGEKIFSNPIQMTDADHFYEECAASVAARAIILDGINITGGYANHIDSIDATHHPFTTKTYFRGGGVFVDGNWTKEFNDPENEDVPNVTDPAKYNIPLVVRNCQFSNNMAGNGGALYSNGSINVYSSHFMQNYSQGPMTKRDQKYIPWTAGGCIATNAYCGVVNTLFDNNEARRGLYPITVTGKEYIPDADARQGFGGVLSVAADSKMRVANCHFMSNKAVAYPSIYNFLTNDQYASADDKQFAFNSIFWGNEVFNVESIDKLKSEEAPSADQIDAFNTKYKASRAKVFHYDAEQMKTYERLFHEYDSLYTYYAANYDTFNVEVTDKLQELRLQADKMEGLYFCSYRKTFGPTGMRPTKEGYLMTKEEHEQRPFADPRGLPVKLKQNDNGDRVDDYSDLFTYVHGNNNVIINRLNNAADGPNFKQPSSVPGLEGYMQNADWLLGRMNLTTDMGWGHLKQKVSRAVSYYITKYTGSDKFDTPEKALEAARKVNPDADEDAVRPVYGLPNATFDGVTEQDEAALYNYLAKRSSLEELTTPRIPIGNQPYMEYTRSTDDSEEVGNMLRISTNPRLYATDVYIDQGVYEYQYVQLDIKGNEVDTMWVATKAKGRNQTGLTWETPTTDLQGAIDMLMSSHNNHDKYVCFLGDDEQHFAPASVFDNRRAFVITSNSLAPLLPDSAMTDYDYSVKSLTFLGGYSYDTKDKPRDPVAHPTVIEMPNAGNRSQLNQLFIIEDMTRKEVQINWMGEFTSRDSVVIPVTFDGLTFINPYSTEDAKADMSTDLGGLMNRKGGAAIYYRWQRQYANTGSVFMPDFSQTLHPDSAMVDGRKVTLPKLTISNCVFMDNGERTEDLSERSSAVRIDHGGGSSLIVNSLFHSNAGAPLYAPHYENMEGENDLYRTPNDVVVVNSTFALNDGHVRLESANSEVHNSLIWLDDLAHDTVTQLELNTDVWDKLDNRNKTGIEGRMTNNAVWGCFRSGDEIYHNDSLSTGNSDVFEGPCFVNPIVDAATAEQRRSRDFRLNPAVRTMNMADSTLYRNRVFFRQYPDSTSLTHHTPQPHDLYWSRSNGLKSLTVGALSQDNDLYNKPRLFGIGMERGAYECRAVMQRVLYVQPTLPASSAGDGSSWQSPFGQGQLQTALDVAAVYTYLNHDADRETRKSYVFVKGSYDSEEMSSISARDGVQIYGGLPGNFIDTAYIDTETKQFTNAECHRYVNYVRSITTGPASPSATPTRINSLVVPGNSDYTTGFLLDGFIFTNPGEELTASPLVLDNLRTTVRNCIFTGNKVTGAPVADIRRGLLYNSLFYGDTASTVVRIGAGGRALNNTIVASRAGDTAIDKEEAETGALENNIALNAADSSMGCFATYLTDSNVYRLPAYLTQYPALGYQLHERSRHINAGTETLPAFADYIGDGAVNFTQDRDLLGNPRRIGGKVDRGAFETWRVEPKQAVELTALTNRIMDDAEIRIASDAEKNASFTNNYGGHKYPHQGSVVYLSDSSAMSMAYADDKDFHDYKGNLIILRPGYMLLKEGASFYGNGHEVRLNYVAAEKRFVNQRYSMTAWPFRYNAADVLSATYDSSTDSLHQTLNPVPFSTYQYSGAARSAKDYVFRTDSSSLWLRTDTTNRSATKGYLMDFGSAQDTLLRFTAFAPELRQYVYTEDNTDKTVVLTQYDHRQAGNGQELVFTRQEDMGWNMNGLPWLVSSYRTDTILEEGNFLRQMYIPHVFYQMDGAGEYIGNGGQVYTSRSWDKGSRMSMGTGFLVQTATQNTEEELIFHLPYYGFNEKPSRPILRMGNRRGDGDRVLLIPDSTTDKSINYKYGRDGIKWMTDASASQLYLIDDNQSRISLLGSAPTETDIHLGVSIPAGSAAPARHAPSEDTYADRNIYTFSLPEPDAFRDYKYVWLIDYKKNDIVNLLQRDYKTEITAGEHTSRFAVRIGGFPLEDKDGGRRYLIFTEGGNLYVRGLTEGDKLQVYSQDGRLLINTTATDNEFVSPLMLHSGYVVRVNDYVQKVLNL
ncbi:MAG: hypothetical protein II970_03315 [Paludibacteraceae bacterium]|nr:hypothetical protein [Paludibacteraceae bacterium]